MRSYSQLQMPGHNRRSPFSQIRVGRKISDDFLRQILSTSPHSDEGDSLDKVFLMPSLVELSAYILGVRLEQAKRLASTALEPPILYRALLRLEEALRSLCDPAIAPEVPSRTIAILRVATAMLETSPTSFDCERLDDIRHVCRDQLEIATRLLRDHAYSLSISAQSASRWFELGTEIVCGTGGGEGPPIPNPPPREPWRWDRPDALTAQVSVLQTSLDILFPIAPPLSDWFDYVTLQWSEWIRIECGIEALQTSVGTAVPIDEDSTSRECNLSPLQQDIVRVVREAGHRIVTEEVLSRLSRIRERVSEGSTKQQLATLVRLGILDNQSHTVPRGYGISSST